MWLLPMSLRAKMALVTLLGIFFVPFAMSDLRGLSHVLTCDEAVTTSLFVQAAESAEETILLSADSTTVETAGLGLCDGLVVDLQLVAVDGDTADVLVDITNTSEFDWQGTIDIDFDGTPIQVAIGSIDAGATESDTVEFNVDAGRSYEITSTLLIGP